MNKEPTTKEIFWILISGSKMPGISQKEIERFSMISQAVGKALAIENIPNIGLLGCAPHSERVLASQEAKRGFHSVNPEAPFSTGTSYNNKFYHDDRLNLISEANAAVFIGGSSGTIEECELCIRQGIRPLIPVAGAGGAGLTLSKRAVNNAENFWGTSIKEQIVSVLISEDSSPEDYGCAVYAVFASAGIITKKKRWQFWK